MDRWLPLQTPDEVLKRVSDGELPASEGMNRLLLLLAATHAWKLYTDIAPVSGDCPFAGVCYLQFFRLGRQVQESLRVSKIA